ncbi:MAG: cadherin-like beta sandwich domain-containing protein [Clostridia bacterium]|nr:cadherin-like beta sandwich domain-containing protein [Clostridia bacterium]
MKITKSILCAVCALAIALSVFTFTAMADGSAKASISVSSSKVTVGDNVTVTVKYESSSEIGSYDFTLEYDASILKYVSGSDSTSGNGKLRFANYNENSSLKSFSRKITFTAISSGSASLKTQSNAIVNNADFTLMSVTEGSRSLTVEPKPTASSDNKLKSLAVSAGTLSPAFSASESSYTLSVEYSVKKLNVSAVAEDSKAKVSISDTELSLGSNKITITVTAENGSKRTYTLNVTRLESKLADVTVVSDGWIFSVAFDADQLAPPEGFTAGTSKIGSKDVLSFSDAAGVFTIVWLKPVSPAENTSAPETDAAPTLSPAASASEAPASTEVSAATDAAPAKTSPATVPEEGWYMLTSNEYLIPFRTISPDSATFVPVPAPASLPAEDWTEDTANIGGHETSVFTNAYCAENDLAIVYLKSADGSEGFFYCDLGSGNIYPYRVPETVTVTVTVTNAPSSSTKAPYSAEPTGSVSKGGSDQNPNTLFIVAAAACAVVLILLIVLIVSARRNSEEKKRLERLVESYTATAAKKRRASRDPASHFSGAEKTQTATLDGDDPDGGDDDDED